MALHLIHLVSSLEKINFGIWNAAIFGSAYLSEQYGFNAYVWVTAEKNGSPPVDRPHIVTQFLEDDSPDYLKALAARSGLSPDKSIFISHGAWLQPTRIGYKMQQAGFRWIYVPHGMLEPWSLQQNRYKKKLYYMLFEKRWSKKAAAVRAVSRAEQDNLADRLTRNVHLVENGVSIWDRYVPKENKRENYLFMARLHYKKGLMPLVRAWNRVMQGEKSKKLIIAGPDDGELKKLQPYLKGNIEYVGPVYDDEKRGMLRNANYYVLPSHSEGFPTSVLEAMSYGAIPLISGGCNFPEVFENGLGHCIEPDEESISRVLLALKNKPFNAEVSKRNYDFVAANYSEACIGEKLYEMYREVLGVG